MGPEEKLLNAIFGTESERHGKGSYPPFEMSGRTMICDDCYKWVTICYKRLPCGQDNCLRCSPDGIHTSAILPERWREEGI